MTYNDEYHEEGTKIVYDGQLIDAEDALNRYKRDTKIKLKYEMGQAEKGQLTFEDIKCRLSEHADSDLL